MTIISAYISKIESNKYYIIMTRGDQRMRNRDKALKEKSKKSIQPNNKVGKPKKTDAQGQKMK